MKDGEQAYYSNYNGVETSIDSDGAYTIKFNGKPTNTLLTAFGGTLPKPTYNSTIAGSLISIEKDGSFVVGDGSKQALRIDKSKTSTTITSGNTVITLDGKGEKLQATSKAVTIEAKDTFKLSSKEALVECTSSIKIKAPKIAIGTSGVELLDHIVQLIDAIGTIVINSPVGPCQPIKTSPMWTQIEALKVKVKSITGSL
jgi:hypothetical protein